MRITKLLECNLVIEQTDGVVVPSFLFTYMGLPKLITGSTYVETYIEQEIPESIFNDYGI